jgi:hypothetical protein
MGFVPLPDRRDAVLNGKRNQSPQSAKDMEFSESQTAGGQMPATAAALISCRDKKVSGSVNFTSNTSSVKF